MKIDRNSDVISSALDSYGQTYAKFGDISAKKAEEPTPVVTVLADGTRETKNVAQTGDYIVTNPGGEQYVVRGEKFAKLYRPTERDGVYEPTGQVVAVKNPFKEPISMMASWGEEQHGAADCWLADTYNPRTGEREGNPRIIGKAEFAQTYRLA